MRWLLGCALVLFVIGCGGSSATFPFEPAEAEVKVELIHILGEHGLSQEQVIDVYNDAAQTFREETNKKFKLLKVTTIENPCSWNPQELRYWIKNIECFEDHARFTGRIFNDVVYVYVLPPAIYRGELYFGGVASAICAYGSTHAPNVLYGNAGEYNASGKPRLGMSSMIMAHEIGHVIGATHDDSYPPASIMHSAANSYYDGQDSIHFTLQSIYQIDQCTRRRRRNIKRRIKKCLRNTRLHERQCRRRIRRKLNMRRLRRLG